jgi:hypothetical protein
MFLVKIVVVINLIKMVEKDMIKAQIMETKQKFMWKNQVEFHCMIHQKLICGLTCVNEIT